MPFRSSGRSDAARLVRAAIIPQPMSTPTAAGITAPTVGITLPTVAPIPQCTSGIAATQRWTNGRLATLRSCWRACSSNATPRVQLFTGTPPGTSMTSYCASPTTRSSIHVAEIAARCDAIAHELLQQLDLGESAGLCAREDPLARHAYLEHAAFRIRHQRHAAELLLERAQQRPRHPRRAQEPPATRAVDDLDHGSGHDLAPDTMMARMELPDDAIAAILDRWPVAALATSGERGPHAVPIVFARAAGVLWSPIDGKPKRGGELARIRHIRRDPRVSLLFSHYEDDWAHLWWLRADGQAQIRSASPHGRGDEEASALVALRRKYPQYERVELVGPGALLLRVAITAQRSWCATAAAVAYISRGG